MSKIENRSDFDDNLCNQKNIYIIYSKITTRTSITLKNLIFKDFLNFNKNRKKQKIPFSKRACMTLQEVITIEISDQIGAEIEWNVPLTS